MPLNIPKLMMVTSGSLSSDPSALSKVMDACKNALPGLQLREKSMESKDLLTLATQLRKATADNDVFFTINSRLDVAMAVNANGIHLGESGISPAVVRKVAPNMTIGVSTHSLEAALQAEQEGADYVIFGPIFHTASKAQYGAPQGLDKLSTVVLSLKIPVIAVGGITPIHAKECFNAGAYGIACINALLHANDVKATIGSFLQRDRS